MSDEINGLPIGPEFDWIPEVTCEVDVYNAPENVELTRTYLRKIRDEVYTGLDRAIEECGMFYSRMQPYSESRARTTEYIDLPFERFSVSYPVLQLQSRPHFDVQWNEQRYADDAKFALIKAAGKSYYCTSKFFIGIERITLRLTEIDTRTDLCVYIDCVIPSTLNRAHWKISSFKTKVSAENFFAVYCRWLYDKYPDWDPITPRGRSRYRNQRSGHKVVTFPSISRAGFERRAANTPASPSLFPANLDAVMRSDVFKLAFVDETPSEYVFQIHAYEDFYFDPWQYGYAFPRDVMKAIHAHSK